MFRAESGGWEARQKEKLPQSTAEWRDRKVLEWKENGKKCSSCV